MPENPCVLDGQASEDSALLIGEIRIMLIDDRPIVVPRSSRSEAGCDLSAYRLAPGRHTIHISYQTSGFSYMVSASYASHSCGFRADPGRTYRAQGLCRVIDETTGSEASDWRGVGGRDAYFEVLRAYAACRDPEAATEFESIREMGSIARRPGDWLLEPCEPWIDLR